MPAGLVHELLDAAAARSGDAPAVRDASGCVSYRQLAAASRAAADLLRRRGVRPGDRVMLRLDGGRDFAALLYGALRLGAVAVPVNPRTGPFHLQWMLDDAEPALVVSGALPAGVSAAVPIADPAGLGGLFHDAPRDLEPVTPVRSDDIALLMYTSGSTAMPRAVVCPHDRVRFAVSGIADRLRYRPDDVVLCRVPMSFDYGLYQLFLCAAAGAAVVLRPDLTEAAVLREARSTGATVLPILPSLATILLRLARLDRGPTPLRLLTNTGAALTAPLAAELRRALPGAALVPMYGMTECKRITIAEPDEDLRYPDTVGRALTGTAVEVVDGAGRPVGPGVVGEIWVRGPHVMAGYWRAPEATAGRFDRPDAADRLLRTGDHGYLDAGGRLYFVGRRDDIFKRKGVRMSAQEVEAAVLDVPGVRAAAVPPPGPDGVLTAWVVGDLAPADVLAAVVRRVEPARVPDECVVVPRLPVTANGKVDRHALRRGVQPFETNS